MVVVGGLKDNISGCVSGGSSSSSSSSSFIFLFFCCIPEQRCSTGFVLEVVPLSILPGGMYEAGRGTSGLERALNRGWMCSRGAGGEETLSSEEMLWFQACCRSTGMIFVASTDTQGSELPIPPFHGRTSSPETGEE